MRTVKSPRDLETSHSDIMRGFLEQALQKAEIAAPYVQEARILSTALEKIGSTEELLNKAEIRDALISACGFSDKASTKLGAGELNEAAKKVLRDIQAIAAGNYRDEIVYRYLLTKGDALGGKMRNITGAKAGTRFAEMIISRLRSRKHEVSLKKSKKGKVQRIAWDDRVVLFDTTTPIVKKNIDLILLSSPNASDYTLDTGSLKDSTKYVACGELKGGIDPAGADEHWKTASSALGRIRRAITPQPPALFFIGAAIEAAMAKEIYDQLKKGELAQAANFHHKAQVSELIDWLISL